MKYLQSQYEINGNTEMVHKQYFWREPSIAKTDR